MTGRRLSLICILGECYAGFDLLIESGYGKCLDVYEALKYQCILRKKCFVSATLAVNAQLASLGTTSDA